MAMATKTRKPRDTKAHEPETEDPDAGRVNLVVVRGEVTAVPELRELESGRRLAALAIRARGSDGRATSVPVTVWEPAAWVEDLAPGTEIVVVGGVRRRFFRTATGTSATRVDVEAAFVGRAGQRRQLEAARRRIEAALEELMTG
jgi:single-stranded DNA-binding protein